MRYLKTWFDGEVAGGAEGGGGEAAATAAAASAAAAAKGGDFSIPDTFDFGTVLPADLKDNPALQKFSSHKGKAWAEQVSRSLISAQGMIGADPNELVRVPADVTKITPEARRAALERFGLPKDAKAWELKNPAQPIAGMDVTSPMAKWFTTSAREAGIFPDQAQTLFEGFGKQIQAANEARNNEFAATDRGNIESLQKEFGKAFDGEVKAASFGVNALAKAAGVDAKEFRDKINAAGLGTDPIFFKAMAKYGKQNAEGGGGGDKGDVFSPDGLSPAAAQSQGNALLKQAMDVMDTNPTEARRLNLEAQKIFASAV